MNSEIKISIIIPAYNEQSIIGKTLETLTRYHPESSWEVIVVDNGSTDETAAIAKNSGAKVISHPIGTIASVRNKGVHNAQGQVLIFLDADVLVTSEWQLHLNDAVERLTAQPLTVTGSRCSAPDNGKLINKYWYSRLNNYEAPYINSGHLITTRVLFDKINGFSENLKTAEDYDFCMKAKSVGATLVNNRNLKVIHEGYPTTLQGFVARERWHGKEDFNSLRSFLESKVALAAAGNIFIFAMAIVFIFFTSSLISLLTYFAIIYVICVGLTRFKFGRQPSKTLLFSSVFFYFYLVGRSLAMFDAISEHIKNSHQGLNQE